MGLCLPPLLTSFIYLFLFMSHPLLPLTFLLYALILISPPLVPLAGHLQTPHQAAGQPFKFTIPESLDRIKEEFQFLQAQYHRCVSSCSGWWSPGGGGTLLTYGQAAWTAVLRACVQAVACRVTVKPCHSFYPPPPLSSLFLGRPFCCLLLLPLFPLCAFVAVPGSPFSCILELHENRQYLRFVYLFCNRLN